MRWKFEWYFKRHEVENDGGGGGKNVLAAKLTFVVNSR